MSSTVVDWTALTATTTAVGAVRQVFKAPTATLTELECHVTTLNPGLSSHAPHRHPNEEIIIVQQGMVEVFSEGTKTRVGPGSVIFHASNHLHGLTNVGETPATYHVINWRSTVTPEPHEGVKGKGVRGKGYRLTGWRARRSARTPTIVSP